MASSEALRKEAEVTCYAACVCVTVETRYNDTKISAIFLRYTEVSFNQGSRACVLNIEGTEDI